MKMSRACSGTLSSENNDIRFFKTAKKIKYTSITCTIVPGLVELLYGFFYPNLTLMINSYTSTHTKLEQQQTMDQQQMNHRLKMDTGMGHRGICYFKSKHFQKKIQTKLTLLTKWNFPALSIGPVKYSFKGRWAVFFIFIQILIEHSVSK